MKLIDKSLHPTTLHLDATIPADFAVVKPIQVDALPIDFAEPVACI